MKDFEEKIREALKGAPLEPKAAASIFEFLGGYLQLSNQKGVDLLFLEKMINTYISLILKEIKSPSKFELFHKRVRHPFDLCQFGLDFIRPLIDFKHSSLQGKSALQRMESQLKSKENVVLLANHQTEPDPQIIHLMLNEKFPDLAEQMIFVAGDRVVRDPLAVPLSLGCNLLCIYSKRYIDHPPEMRETKLQHNQKTMSRMLDLFKEGGHIIYVAPSGGRDRFNMAENRVPVTPFDASSVEMFYLMGRQAGTPTHFYPLALSTYNLLPPPESIEKELGERRKASICPVHLHFGDEIEMEVFPGNEIQDKKERRAKRAAYITELVSKMYNQFPK